MTDIGASRLPPSASPLWDAWARPVAALLRDGHAPGVVAAFCHSHGANPEKRVNLLAWLDLGGYVTLDHGVYTLTDSGREWLGDYRLAPELVDEAGEAPAQKSRASTGTLDLREVVPYPGSRLTPLEPVRSSRNGTIWLCSCSCEHGKTHEASATHIRSGRTKSCGCLRAELRRSGRWSKVWRVA